MKYLKRDLDHSCFL